MYHNSIKAEYRSTTLFKSCGCSTTSETEVKGIVRKIMKWNEQSSVSACEKRRTNYGKLGSACDAIVTPENF